MSKKYCFDWTILEYYFLRFMKRRQRNIIPKVSVCAQKRQPNLFKEKICLLQTTEQILRWRPLRKLEMKMRLERCNLSLTSPHASTVYSLFRSENIAELWLIFEISFNKNPKWIQHSLFFIHWSIQGTNLQIYISICMKMIWLR